MLTDLLGYLAITTACSHNAYFKNKYIKLGWWHRHFFCSWFVTYVTFVTFVTYILFTGTMILISDFLQKLNLTVSTVSSQAFFSNVLETL